MTTHYSKNGLEISNADAMDLYQQWDSPTVIIADGPYGVSGFPGDPPTPDNLGSWYEPHIKKWSEYSSPQTTLWFWNTEVGWANVHPYLIQNGWSYRACYIWNKGIAHVAGNANTKSLRKLPVVTEVCVQYVKKASFKVNDKQLSMKDWLRYEWARTGLPFSLTNEACGVKNAATRKYFTKCHLWYYPPVEAFEMFSSYANKHGKAEGRPYFSIDGKKPMSKDEWEAMRAKFYCPFGITNVWDEPPVNGEERLKRGSKAIHLNQKPLRLMQLIIEISSDKGDVIWEPFGGLCTGAIAAQKLERIAVAAEIDAEVFQHAVKRAKAEEVLSRTLFSDEFFKEIHDVAVVSA